MKSSKMFVWNSQFKKYAMLHINCNRDIKNYVSSDHILQMFTLLNVDFETTLHGEQKIVLLSYTCIKN